jgi:hypothetical protein
LELTNERLKEKASKMAARRALLSEIFLPQFLDLGVRKGLMLSSFPEAKNSSKM